MKKFWDWIRNEEGERVLRLEGPIDTEDFWNDGVTPQAFREELESETGNLTLWINSPGGSVWAAAEIYTMLRDYPGKVTVKIDAIAASAASVVAMAGDQVLMSPVSMLMIHDPMTIAMGNVNDMEKAIHTLNEVKDSIVNAYADKTGLRRSRIADLMEQETWMNARKAVELGFADRILFDEDKKTQKTDEEPEEEEQEESVEDGDEEEDSDSGKSKKSMKLKNSPDVWQFSGKIMNETMLNHLGCVCNQISTDLTEEAEAGTDSTVNNSDPEDPSEQTPEPASDESQLAVETQPVDEKHTDNSTPEPEKDPQPVIGLDGKTEDGSMPYEILMEKLEWLK